MIGRRGFLGSAGAALVLTASPGGRAGAAGDEAGAGLAEIEARLGGRLGVAVLDTGTGARLAHRGDEPFPLCSTFKVLAAAAVLVRVDAGVLDLERPVAYTRADLVPYSPVTGTHVEEGALPLGALCEAAITRSDNTAGNLLLGEIGGPAGLTAFARGLGDTRTRLDRIEPDLNEALSDDPRDTTTPEAMLADLRVLLLGERLSTASRARLDGWLGGNRTGDARLRAGLPAGWRVGDKTGTGERGTANDVAILRPPGRAPILAAVYLTGTGGGPDERNAAIAAVGRTVAAHLSRGAP